MPGHVLSAKYRSFAWADLDPSKFMIPLAHPSQQRYGITVQIWRTIISYRHVCTVIP